MSPGLQVFALFVLAIPIACISWTLTHEEISRELREWCARKSKSCDTLLQRKFFYLFTCEYCFSHYVTVAVLAITNYTLLFPGWRGTLIAFFSLVWVANVYLSLFGRLRLDIRHERSEIAVVESKVKKVASDR